MNLTLLNALDRAFESEANVKVDQSQVLQARLVCHVAQAELSTARLLVVLERIEFDERCRPIAARQRQRFYLVHSHCRLEQISSRDLDSIDVYHVQIRICEPQTVRAVLALQVVVRFVVGIRADRRADNEQIVLGLQVQKLFGRTQQWQIVAIVLLVQTGRPGHLAELPHFHMLLVLEKHEIVAKVNEALLLFKKHTISITQQSNKSKMWFKSE